MFKWVPESSLSSLQEAMEKITGVAVAPTGAERTQEEKVSEGAFTRVRWVEVEIHIDPPVVDGWSVVGCQGRDLFIVPGCAIPLEFIADDEPGFILQQGNEYKKEQLPKSPLNGLREFALALEAPPKRAAVFFDPVTFLAGCCKGVRTDGFVKKETAWMKDMTPTFKHGVEACQDPEDLEDQDWEKGRAVFRWIKEDLAQREHLSEYEYNLSLVVLDGISLQNAGLAATAVVAYDGSITSDLSQEHFGEVGEKKELDLTFLGEVKFDARYGVMTIQKFLDEQNRLAVWKTARPMNLVKGEKVRIFATVKAHEVYENQAQTVLTRCKKVLDTKVLKE
jgi:hypothetical protein